MYIPKNQIQTNLSTPGSQFYVVFTGKDYIGVYWKRANGQVFSGTGPSDPSSVEIKPYSADFNANEYIKKNGTSPDPHINGSTQQYLNPLPPTPDNYKYNNYERYFIRRVNQPLFVEIDSKLYSQFEDKSSDVPYTIYISFKMPWLITGDKEHVYRSNKNIVLLREQNYKVYGLQEYLQEDYLQYYK
jgi:hypothetical protein